MPHPNFQAVSICKLRTSDLFQVSLIRGLREERACNFDRLLRDGEPKSVVGLLEKDRSLFDRFGTMAPRAETLDEAPVATSKDWSECAAYQLPVMLRPSFGGHVRGCDIRQGCA